MRDYDGSTDCILFQASNRQRADWDAIGLYVFHSSEKTLTHSYAGNAHFSYNGFSLFGPLFNLCITITIP